MNMFYSKMRDTNSVLEFTQNTDEGILNNNN